MLRAKLTFGLMAVTCAFTIGHCPSIAQPLGEQIDQDKSKLQDDKAQLRMDSQQANRANQSTRNYIQQTQSWIEDADMQAQDKQQQLNALEAQQKSKAIIQRLLNTPGNQLYILNTWLKNEAVMKSQAQSNLATALAKLRANEAAAAQDRYQFNVDVSCLNRDVGTYRQEMDDHADDVRQVQQARFARGRHHFFTNYAQSAYDSGSYYNMGTGTWGAKPRFPQ